jgi:hypothetical protein
MKAAIISAEAVHLYLINVEHFFVVFTSSHEALLGGNGVFTMRRDG